MLFAFINSLQNWLYQVKSIFLYKLDHMTPTDYCITIVFAISIGYCLLKSRI